MGDINVYGHLTSAKILFCCLLVFFISITSMPVAVAEEAYVNSAGMKFVFIKPGEFLMGSPENESMRGRDELSHNVLLTRGYYIQTTEATQEQWFAVMGNNPSVFKDCGDGCPVENVSWNEVQEFIQRLNRMEQTTSYRLPTEAEWEYACRAGADTPYAFGKDLVRRQANYDDSIYLFSFLIRNFKGKTNPAGNLEANRYGLYDMHGNVWEWCQDWYGAYPEKMITDPEGPSHGSNRVNRGGSWISSSADCRCAKRFGNSPDYKNDLIGFRLVKMP